MATPLRTKRRRLEPRRTLTRRPSAASLSPWESYGMHTSPAALCRHAPRLEGGFLPPCGGGSRRGVAPNSDSSEPFQRQMRSERDPPPCPAPTIGRPEGRPSVDGRWGAGTPAAVERSPTAKRYVHPVAWERGERPSPSGGRWPEGPDEGLPRSFISFHFGSAGGGRDQALAAASAADRSSQVRRQRMLTLVRAVSAASARKAKIASPIP